LKVFDVDSHGVHVFSDELDGVLEMVFEVPPAFQLALDLSFSLHHHLTAESVHHFFLRLQSE
jgi:hypothetical protein